MRAITWLNTLNRMYLRFPYDLRGILAKLVVSSNRHSELARLEIIELRAANVLLEQENAKLMAELEASRQARKPAFDTRLSAQSRRPESQIGL